MVTASKGWLLQVDGGFQGSILVLLLLQYMYK